jgi:urease subunit gamma/beta
MRLIPWEEERLQLFAAAELARRRRAAGLLLNHPEALAIICDAMLEAAREGRGYAEVEAVGRASVEPDHVLPGVRELLDEVRLEVLFGDGSRVIALVDPLDRGVPRDPFGPGALVIGDPADVVVNEGRDTIDLEVTSTSRRRIRVSSHFPFHRLNARLVFNREAARGFRLDLPAGAYVGFEPGESRTVRLVRLAGRQGAGAAPDDAEAAEPERAEPERADAQRAHPENPEEGTR